MRLRGVGACVGSRWQTATASPRPPLLLRGSNRFALPPLTRPTKNQQSILEIPRRNTEEGRPLAVKLPSNCQTRKEVKIIFLV